MKTLYTLIGPPAVGKTTWTEQSGLDATVINRDSIVERIAARHGLTYDEAYVAPPEDAEFECLVSGMEKYGLVVQSDLTWRTRDYELCRAIHRSVAVHLTDALQKAASENRDVILDMTNMVAKDRFFYMQHFGDDFRKVAVLFDFQGDRVIKRIKERCAARHEKLQQHGRSKNIPESVIDKMIASYEPPTSAEGFQEIVAYDILLLMLMNPNWNR